MDNQSFRDMCAAMAMQGLLASTSGRPTPGAMSTIAFDVAEAMLAEREKRDVKRDRYGRVVGG